LVSENEGWYPSICKTMAQKEQGLSKAETIFVKKGLNLLRFKISYSFRDVKSSIQFRGVE